jgi:N-acetyl-1-D-myo-inositol-2-amino-2-deoxy-alpha-D-glucopyranoside deacetylase
MKRILKSNGIILLVIALLLGVLLIGLALSRRPEAVSYPDFPDLSLAGRQRLLVLAPHCDDETLSSAGLIQAALRQKMDVKVVIATNGDGFLFATMQDFHRLYPRHQDFIRMGVQRQQESLSALEVLGLSSDQVIFLSYPDRGTPALWNEHWDSADPYTSPYIGADKSPYPVTYNPNADYSGESYLADLVAIIKEYQPDLIVYPDPEDVHPDHWGLSVFTRAALAQVEQEHPAYQPAAYTYLVHRPDYPHPKGLHPDQSLLPPPRLYAINPSWFSLGLPLADEVLKGSAVLHYRSQLPLLHTLLLSFVRRNELFTQPEPAEIPALAEGSWQNPQTWRDAAGQPIQPVQRDPERDFLSRSVLPGADIVALYAAKTPDNSLALCIQLRGRVEPTLVYTMRVSAFGAQGVHHILARSGENLTQGETPVVKSGSFACTQVSISDLGNPGWLFAGGNVEELGVDLVDQVAWQQVDLATPVAR